MEPKELSWRERGRLWLRLGIRVVLAVAAILLLVFAVPPLFSLFMPFVLALVLAWILNPLVRWLQQKLKISRKPIALVVIILVIGVAGGVLFWFVYGLGSEIYTLISDWTTVGSDLQSGLSALREYFSRFPDLMPAALVELLESGYDKLMVWLRDVVPGLLASAGKTAGSFAMKVPGAVVGAVIFLVASYFIVADYPRLRLMATDRMSPGVHSFLSRVKKIALAAFGGYIRAQLILSLAVFFILLIGFTVIGQKYALLLAFVFAVMDFIPIIGSGTVMVPWAVVDLILGNYRGALSLMIIWGFICVFRRVAEPKVVGDQTGLSPIMSLISIYVGMRLGGVLGMILGPVLVLIILNVAKMDVIMGTRRDIRMAVHDVRALLKNGDKREERKE